MDFKSYTLAVKTLVVYAHPKDNSFNHAILGQVVKGLESKGHEVKVKDLNHHAFNGILTDDDFNRIYSGNIPADIKAEQADIAWANRLVFIYPFWWWDRPAVLKGWIDRSWLHGFAYVPHENGARGLLKHEKAMVIVTCGTSEEEFRKQGVFDILHKPMTDGTLRFSGIDNVTLCAFYDVGSDLVKKREEILSAVEKTISKW